MKKTINPLFKGFDFSVLNSANFKEDAVREKIIAPVLNKLGYAASGATRFQQSKTLVDPYVMIGAEKHEINIIPDYTLYVDEIPLAIVVAKGPQESIYESEYVEQAYSYAIHPEIRAKYYGLCNGRELILYSISQWEPILRVPTEKIDSYWKGVELALLPKNILKPAREGFVPDFGMSMLKMGLKKDTAQRFVSRPLQLLARAEDDLYVANTNTVVAGINYMLTLDLSRVQYEQLLSLLPPDVSQRISKTVKQAPYLALLEGKVALTVDGIFGELTQGQFEEFVPIRVTQIMDASYDPKPELQPRQP